MKDGTMTHRLETQQLGTHRIGRRCFLASTLASPWLASLAGPCARAEDVDPSAPFFFVVAADPQLFWGPLKHWRTTISHINRLKPPLAVVCGDLIQNPGNEEQATAYLRAAGKLDPSIRLCNVAGNHDVNQSPTPEDLAWFEKHFGKPWYALEHGGCMFIVLESDVLNRPGRAPEMAKQQMAWLKETLAQAEAKKCRHTFVFKHYPMCLGSIDEPDQYFNVPLPRRKELLELFHRHNVTAVFSGHHHRNHVVKDGRLELITTASSGKPLGSDPIGLRIVKVFPDRIEHKYYGFDELPEKVF